MDDVDGLIEQLRDGCMMVAEDDTIQPNVDEMRSAMNQAADELSRLRDDVNFLRPLAQAGFDVQRVMEWSESSPRKPANIAFTSGGERQAAYLIENAERKLRDENERLKRQIIRQAHSRSEQRRLCVLMKVPQEEFFKQ